MKARRVICLLLTLLLAGSVWASEGDTPAYRPPILLTVHDSQLPAVQCTATAIKGGAYNKVPLTVLASGCASWTDETCEIWAPQSGPGVVWGVLSTLMTPGEIIGHEAMHCWLHGFHKGLS